MSTLTAAQLGLGGRPPTLLIDGAFVLFAESLAQLPASHPAYRHEDERGNNHHCDDNANNVGRIHDWPPFRPTYSPWSRALHRRAFFGCRVNRRAAVARTCAQLATRQFVETRKGT